MSQKNTIDPTAALWMSVLRHKGVGPKTFWKMFEKDSSFSDALKVNIQNEVLQYAQNGFGIIHTHDSFFSHSLRALDDCPPILSYAGHVEAMQQPALGIVGARNASIGGMKIARLMAYELSKCGYTIVSGMARGIDGAAHEGALLALQHAQENTQHPNTFEENPTFADKKTGLTIAVLAGGIDQLYPPEHARLYQSIQKNGCVLAEMPFSTAPSPTLFPRRNRIIAGLSQGLIVIEAAERSGTLITAEYALHNGKDVFVVPGSPLDPRSKGGNKLIKQGAILVETAQDIIDYYEMTAAVHNEINKKASCSVNEVSKKSAPMSKNNPETYTTLPQHINQQVEHINKSLMETPPVPTHPWLFSMGLDSFSIDDVFELARHENKNITMNAFMKELAMMEMNDLIIRLPAGMIQRKL